MSEMRILIEGPQVAYNGLFRVDELYNIIKTKIMSRGYYIEERGNREDILENGKQVVVEMMAIHTMSDYDKGRIKLQVTVRGLKDKVVTVDGHKQKYQQGEVKIVFYAYHETDYRGKWEDSGFAFLTRTLMDKFVRHDRAHKIEDRIKEDTNELMNEVRSYLNMTRFKVSHDLHPHQE